MNPLVELQTIVDSGLFVLIWLVQLVIYPSFAVIEEEHFYSWHTRFSAMISLVVTPLMVIQVGIEAVVMMSDIRWWRIILIILIWLSTFFLSIPCHRRLHTGGKDAVVIRRLVLTNWIRTLLWSLLFWQTGAAILARSPFFQ
jgi:hypothetical protein